LQSQVFHIISAGWYHSTGSHKSLLLKWTSHGDLSQLAAANHKTAD